jgi:hypothetical protein
MNEAIGEPNRIPIAEGNGYERVQRLFPTG